MASQCTRCGATVPNPQAVNCPYCNNVLTAPAAPMQMPGQAPQGYGPPPGGYGAPPGPPGYGPSPYGAPPQQYGMPPQHQQHWPQQHYQQGPSGWQQVGSAINTGYTIFWFVRLGIALLVVAIIATGACVSAFMR
jgi:uncharacterized membrane protein